MVTSNQFDGCRDQFCDKDSVLIDIIDVEGGMIELELQLNRRNKNMAEMLELYKIKRQHCKKYFSTYSEIREYCKIHDEFQKQHNQLSERRLVTSDPEEKRKIEAELEIICEHSIQSGEKIKELDPIVDKFGKIYQDAYDDFQEKYPDYDFPCIARMFNIVDIEEKRQEIDEKSILYLKWQTDNNIIDVCVYCKDGTRSNYVAKCGGTFHKKCLEKMRSEKIESFICLCSHKLDLK